MNRSIMEKDKMRLEQLLVSQGLVRSRAHAKDLIVKGHIICDKEVANKAKVKMVFTGLRHFNH